MENRRRHYFDVLWLAGGQVISVLVALGTMKIWAIYLEPAQMGLMALIIGTSSILVGVLASPLLQAIFVSYPTYQKQNTASSFRSVCRAVIKRRICRIIVLILTFGGLLVWFLDLHWSTSFVVAGLFSVDAFRIFERNMFAAAHRQREVTAITTGDLIFRLIFVWFFLLLFQDSKYVAVIDNLAYVAVIGNLVGAILFFIIVKNVFSLEAYSSSPFTDHTFKIQLRKKITQIARPLMPSMILANVTEMGNRYFIGATIGLEATGLFVVSYGFVKRPYGMLNHVGEMKMVPLVKLAITEKDSKRAVRVRLYWLILISGFSLLGAALFYLFREPLIQTFLSDKYIGATDLLFGIAIAVTLFNISNIFSWFSITLENSRAVLVNNLVGSVITMGLTVVLCLKFGIIGAVWALVVGYGFQLLASLLTFRWSRHAAIKKS